MVFFELKIEESQELSRFFMALGQEKRQGFTQALRSFPWPCQVKICWKEKEVRLDFSLMFTIAVRYRAEEGGKILRREAPIIVEAKARLLVEAGSLLLEFFELQGEASEIVSGLQFRLKELNPDIFEVVEILPQSQRKLQADLELLKTLCMKLQKVLVEARPECGKIRVRFFHGPETFRILSLTEEEISGMWSITYSENELFEAWQFVPKPEILISDKALQEAILNKVNFDGLCQAIRRIFPQIAVIFITVTEVAREGGHLFEVVVLNYQNLSWDNSSFYLGIHPMTNQMYLQLSGKLLYLVEKDGVWLFTEQSVNTKTSKKKK